LDKEESGRSIPIREGLFKMPAGPGAKPSLIGTRCAHCGQMSFPARGVCAGCSSQELEHIPLNTKGKLYAYTIIGYPPPGLTAPYAIGYVDLPEGVRVFSILTEWSADTLKVGAEVEMVLDRFRRDKEGNELITYKFRPVKREEVR